MYRATACALVFAAGGSAARAGELDRESPAAALSSAAATAPVLPTLAHPGGSEMDRESPRPAHGWRWGARSYGWGWGGYYPYRSYISFGFGYPSYFAYRSFGFSSAFYGGFYPAFGWPYQPYFPAYYYAPYAYGWWW